MKVKNSIKSEHDKENKKRGKDDSSSGLDVDITGNMKKADIIVEDKKGSDVSFIYGNGKDD